MLTAQPFALSARPPSDRLSCRRPTARSFLCRAGVKVAFLVSAELREKDTCSRSTNAVNTFGRVRKTLRYIEVTVRNVFEIRSVEASVFFRDSMYAGEV